MSNKENMRTATHEYNDITVRMPQGADPKPLKAFVEAMGWSFVVSNAAKENVATMMRIENDLPSKRLRGLFKMSSDFDYKESLYQALKEKYEL